MEVVITYSHSPLCASCSSLHPATPVHLAQVAKMDSRSQNQLADTARVYGG